MCHSASTSITKVEFEKKWKVISSALVALGLDQKDVDRMKTEPIDHDTERRVEEEVNKWKLEIEPRVERLEDDVLKMKGEMSRIQGSLSDKNTSELANCLPDKVANVFGRSQEIQQVIEPIEAKKLGIVVITGGQDLERQPCKQRRTRAGSYLKECCFVLLSQVVSNGKRCSNFDDPYLQQKPLSATRKPPALASKLEQATATTCYLHSRQCRRCSRIR